MRYPIILLLFLALSLVLIPQPAMAQATWCYTFDFTVDDGDFEPFPAAGVEFGTWDGGWITTDATNVQGGVTTAHRQVAIGTSFSFTDFTLARMTYDFTLGFYDSAGLTASFITIGAGTVASQNYATITNGTNKILEWTGNQNGSTLVIGVRSSRDVTSPYTYGGSAVIKSLYLEGTGSSPFPGNECALQASFTADPESGTAPLEVDFTDTSIGDIVSWDWDFDDGGTSTDQNPTHEFEEPGEYLVTLTVSDGEETDDYQRLITVVEGGVGGGSWTRPLRASDEHPEQPLYDWVYVLDVLFDTGPFGFIEDWIAPPAQYRVTAPSIAPGAPVMAATGGTVVDIVHASGEMCSVWGLLLNNGCLFAGPDTADFLLVYKFDIDFDVQLVTIELEDGKQLKYMVRNASNYVTLGMEIQGGCVIGETIAAEVLGLTQEVNTIASIIAERIGWGGHIKAGASPGFGVALLEYRDPSQVLPMLPLLPSLTVYNEDAIPCNAAPGFQDCLVSNPDLMRGGESWEFFGSVEPYELGVILGPGGYIQQSVNLPDESTFTLRLGIYSYLFDLFGPNPITSTERVLLLRVGQYTVQQTVTMTSEYQELAVEIPTPEPDTPGGMYSVRVSNVSGEGSIIIDAACLSADDHELNPLACYFNNPDMDTRAGWTTAVILTGNGWVGLAHSQSISQSVTLRPNLDDSPRTYRLEVEARVIPKPWDTYNPSAGSASINYLWGEEDDDLALDLSWNQPGSPGYPDASFFMSVDIVVDEETTDDFVFTAEIVDNSTILAIAIERVCITADPVGPPQSGFDGPFTTSCATIPVPTDNTIGPWTMYHWRNLDKFFNCHLMVLLNKWYKTFDQFRVTMLWVARYWIATVHRIADWGQGFIWWLNGHFRNIAVGQVTVINQANTCNGDIICGIVEIIRTLAGVLTPVVTALTHVVDVLLGILIGAVNLFFTIIGGLVSFVVAIVIRLFTFLQLGHQLLMGIVSAWNTATPTAIPGLPTCNIDPSSSLICRGVWVLDNTILAGRWGVLFTILLSIGAIHLILWAVSEFRGVLLKTWSSS